MLCGYGDVRNLIFKLLIVFSKTKGSINEKFDFYVGSLEGLFFNLVLLAIHGLLDYTTKMVKEFISFHQQCKKLVIEKWFYEYWPPNIHAKRPWWRVTFQCCVTRRALPKRFLIFEKMWICLRGITNWTIWINNFIFKIVVVVWTFNKLNNSIGQSF